MRINGERLFYFLAAILLLLVLPAAWYFPFQFDDAFISFRITENIYKDGQPYLFADKAVYTSTSLLYPWLNLLPASLFGTGWTANIPVWNGFLLVFTMLICLYKAGKSTGTFKAEPLLISFLLLLPWFLEFRNLIYANSGLETTWYMLFLSLTILPGGNRQLAPWLIFIRPEGWLAGWAVLLESLLERDFARSLKLGMQIFFSLILWAACGFLLFGDFLPQSLAAKANHFIDRANEIAKGLSYLLFAGHGLPMAVFIAAIYFNRKFRNNLRLPVIWAGLYLSFFSFLAAWWPWYLPPLFVAFWYLSAEASHQLYQHLFPDGSSRLQFVLLFSGLMFWAGWQIKSDYPKICEASAAFTIRKDASRALCHFLEDSLGDRKNILLEPLGMTVWFGKNLQILDYPGLANPEMAGFLKSLNWKVPHRLTNPKTDSAILEKFKPDVLVLWPEEAAAFRGTQGFEKEYQLRKKLSYFPAESRMDSVAVFLKIRN